MILTCFCVILLTVHINAYHGPTFRSSIMEGHRPILRMPVENSAEHIESSPEEESQKEERWIEDLRSEIKSVVDTFGHTGAKPHIKKLVEEAENNNNVLLHVAVNRKGVSDIKYKHQMRAAEDDSLKHPIMTPEPEPQWLVDFKFFIKDLIGRYGKRRLDEYVTPVVKSIQKQHNILVKDVDVDHYGEVFVTYSKDPHHRTRTRSKKRNRKQRKSSEES